MNIVNKPKRIVIMDSNVLTQAWVDGVAFTQGLDGLENTDEILAKICEVWGQPLEFKTMKIEEDLNDGPIQCITYTFLVKHLTLVK